MLSRFDRIKIRLSEPVDIASLVFFRVVFGIILLFHVVHEFQSGNVEHVWVLPQIHFTYSGFDWLPLIPGVAFYGLFSVLFVCGILIAVGLFYRTAVVLFFLVWSFTFLSAAAAYQNHFYLLCLISGMLMFMPANRSFSLDVYFRRVERASTVPYWTVFLIRIQFAMVYFFGGVAKFNPDWMAGHPIDLWLERRSDYFLIGPYTAESWLIYLIAWGGLALDLLVSPFLFWKRTRKAAYLVTLGFHLTNNWLFKIGIFPWFMIFGTLIFFDPGWPRKLWKRVLNRFDSGKRSKEHDIKPPRSNSKDKAKGRTTSSNSIPAAPGSAAGRSQRISSWGIALLGAYLAVQLFLPLRPHFYPGNTSWTEEGHFFSWRMMLQDKRIISQSFNLVNPRTHDTRTVVLKDYFEYWQAENMLQTPEFIRQFAVYLAKEHAPGETDMEVKVDVLVSLNGREPQRLIDPEVNLAKMERELRPAKWILPLTTPLPE